MDVAGRHGQMPQSVLELCHIMLTNALKSYRRAAIIFAPNSPEVPPPTGQSVVAVVEALCLLVQDVLNRSDNSGVELGIKVDERFAREKQDDPGDTPANS
jgi:hypothetical protein